MSNDSVWVATLSTNRRAGPQDLVGQLLGCHDRIHRFLALARKVASQARAPETQVRQACGAIKRYFRVALPLHVADEEESLYPRLLGCSPRVDRALELMREQHSQHEEGVNRFVASVELVRLHPGSELKKLELLRAAAPLERFFADHLGLEETEIFPVIRESISKESQDEIAREIQDRRRVATD